MSALAQTFLVAHIVCAVVGFGGSLLSAQSDAPASARQPSVGPQWLVDLATFGVGVFGLLTAWAGNWSLRADWLSIAFVLYIAWLAVHHGLIRPQAAKRLTAEVRRRLLLGRWLAAVLLVAAVVVMVVKPSF